MTTTTTEAPDTTGWAEIRVATPLPLEVAGTLMQLIGTAWPDARVSTKRRGFGDDYALTMLVDHRRRPKKVTKKAALAISEKAAESRAEAEEVGVGGADFLRFEDSSLVTAVPKELMHFLGGIAHSIMSGDEAGPNYLEWIVTTAPDAEGAGARYVLCIARSEEQTPHEMHARTKAELADLRARLHDQARALDNAQAANPQGVAHVLRDLAGPEGD